MLESFESISPTAILTSYPRTFTDIPYEKEIFKWLSKNCNENVKLNKLLAPEIEARYKLTDKLYGKKEKDRRTKTDNRKHPECLRS